MRLAADGPVTLRDPACPLLVLAFANDAAERTGAPVRVAWDGLRLTVGAGRLHADGERDRLGDVHARESLTVQYRHVPARARRSRRAFAARSTTTSGIDSRRWRLRTLAPATEESRRRGAGGG